MYKSTFIAYASQLVSAIEYLDSKKLLFNRILQTNHILLNNDGLLKVLFLDCKLRKDCKLSYEEYCFSTLETIQSKNLSNFTKQIKKTYSHFYSLGLILFHWFFGKPLFREKNLDLLQQQKLNLKSILKEYFKKNEKISFPDHLYSLFKQLLLKYKRLSFKSLKSNPFFAKIDWSSVSSGKCDPNLLFIKKQIINENMDHLLNKKNQMVAQMQNNPIDTLLAPNEFGHTYIFDVNQK